MWVTKHLFLSFFFFFSTASLLLPLHSSLCFVFFFLIRHLSPLKLQCFIIRSGCIISMATPCTLCRTWANLRGSKAQKVSVNLGRCSFYSKGENQGAQHWHHLKEPKYYWKPGTILCARKGIKTPKFALTLVLSGLNFRSHQMFWHKWESSVTVAF